LRNNAVPKQSEHRVNILMVDDHEKNLRALEVMLADVGQNLFQARSGEEALRAILEHEFAVILLDVQMPGMDGFETAALIREREHSRHTPIIFVTPIGKTETHISKGYSLDAVDYLFKPVVPEILRARIAVFVELSQKAQQIRWQEKMLRELDRKEQQRQLAEAKQRWETEHLREEMEKERKIAHAMAQKAEELSRVMAEREAALEARSRLAAILEAAPDLVATSTDSNLLYINRAGRRMLGLSDDEDISALGLLDFRSESGRRFMASEALPYALEHGVWSGESILFSREGREVPVSQVVIAHKNSAGTLEFFWTIARDISDQKQRGAQLRKSSKEAT